MRRPVPAYLVDTNILLRYLTNDEPTLAAAAQRLFERLKSGEVVLHIPFITVAETIFTLQSYYGIDRSDIGRELLKVLNARGVVLTCPAWVLDAVDEYRTKDVSFGDACLAAEARTTGCEIASFDKGLSKFPGVTRYEPK
jgi:predicted nucleic acid-binding protein